MTKCHAQLLHPQFDLYVQGETILGTCFIEVNVVYTFALLTTLFRYHHHIGQPFWVLYLPYKTCCSEIVYFRLNDLMSIRVESPHLLPYWLGIGEDVQFVRSHRWIYPNHIRVSSDEYINVVQQRESYLLPFFIRPEGANVCEPLWFVQLYFF